MQFKRLSNNGILAAPERLSNRVLPHEALIFQALCQLMQNVATSHHHNILIISRSRRDISLIRLGYSPRNLKTPFSAFQVSLLPKFSIANWNFSSLNDKNNFPATKIYFIPVINHRNVTLNISFSCKEW